MQCSALHDPWSVVSGHRPMSRTVYIGGIVPAASSVCTQWLARWRAVQPLNRITRRPSLSGLHYF